MAPARFAYPIPPIFSDDEAAPLLCAGIIGYRALKLSRVGPGQRLGLAGFGASVEELPDGLRVRGGRLLEGCVCESHGDHRIAMAAAVAGLLAAGETVVRGAACVDVSFPGFPDVLKQIQVE
ncbi:MAG: hypothetical protein K6T29_10295 [Peptococcaceae bacterium]|nr:hypothetical protein [Peptococcaceae bacterium]